MIVSEYIDNRCFSFDTEKKLLTIDAVSEYRFDIEADGIKDLANLLRFIEVNKLI